MSVFVFWTEERCEELGRLWALGLSGTEIGKALGCTKNAVIGRAHRLRLAARESPIKPLTPARKTVIKKERFDKPISDYSPGWQRVYRRVGDGGVAKTLREAQADWSAHQRAVAHRETLPALPSLAKLGRPARVTRLIVAERLPHCQWIEGDPKQRQFCDDPTKHGSPYCDTHHAICYRSREDLRNNAA